MKDQPFIKSANLVSFMVNINVPPMHNVFDEICSAGTAFDRFFSTNYFTFLPAAELPFVPNCAQTRKESKCIIFILNARIREMTYKLSEATTNSFTPMDYSD